MNAVNAYETRRRNATSIVFMGVMAAEFGDELEAYKQPTLASSQAPATDYSVVRHACQSLTYILMHPPGPRLPMFSPIRRCAIDLIGRAFPVWEPFLGMPFIILLYFFT